MRRCDKQAAEERRSLISSIRTLVQNDRNESIRVSRVGLGIVQAFAQGLLQLLLLDVNLLLLLCEQSIGLCAAGPQRSLKLGVVAVVVHRGGVNCSSGARDGGGGRRSRC